jgi:UDP-N-acetylmuramyl pentapeptide phosphotransferase/UDP-N-acetylglucosamine-1-phosphate transferase
METGSMKKVITILLGILIAFFIANVLSNAIVILAGLKGPAGMVVSLVVYVVIFFSVLHLLERYAHIAFFGFGRG